MFHLANNRRKMLGSVQTERRNFSKIGKYISNKLHHVHRPKTQRSPEQLKPLPSKPKKTNVTQETSTPKQTLKPMRIKKPEFKEPSVGTYKVNYRVVDKNPRNTNFSNSTPHFFREKYHAHVTTSYHKEYPDPPLMKQKGLTELKRMTGRHQIKGSIRHQGEDPHQNRFLSSQLTPVTSPKNVSFAKMSPRKDIIEGATQPLPSYDFNSEFGKRRMDSHIYGFDRQTERGQVFPGRLELTEDYRTGTKVPLLGRSIDWNRQLSREGPGQLPGYMETVNSRMGVSLVNLKTMKMNCSDVANSPPLKVSTSKLTQSTTGPCRSGAKENSNLFD